MEGREIKSMLLKSNDCILSDGRCSNCGTETLSIEDGQIVLKGRILKIDRNTGDIKVKCRNVKCKRWVFLEHYKILFN